jgi:hypothetical protein
MLYYLGTDPCVPVAAEVRHDRLVRPSSRKAACAPGTLPRGVAALRTSAVSSLRNTLTDGAGAVRELWERAGASFRETFGPALEAAREHVPEPVAEAELSIEQAEGQLAQPAAAAYEELAGVESALNAAEARLQAQAAETGDSL